MANGHGGARAGAGRKPKAQKFQAEIATLERGIADRLPQLLANMLLLADGGFEQVVETWEPAGLIERDDYTPGDDGKVIRTRVLVFPDKPGDELVLIRRTSSIAAPDRKANEYLINRVAGTPTQQLEIDPDPDGAIAANTAAMEQAARELAEWRRMQSAQLSNLLNAPPTPPTSATST